MKTQNVDKNIKTTFYIKLKIVQNIELCFLHPYARNIIIPQVFKNSKNDFRLASAHITQFTFLNINIFKYHIYLKTLD